MKFEISVSKGALHVWSTTITVEADDKEEAESTALALAKENIEGTDEITWEDNGHGDVYNVQVEYTEEIEN